MKSDEITNINSTEKQFNTIMQNYGDVDVV